MTEHKADNAYLSRRFGQGIDVAPYATTGHNKPSPLQNKIISVICL
jgi:hypothetical protein